MVEAAGARAFLALGDSVVVFGARFDAADVAVVEEEPSSSAATMVASSTSVSSEAESFFRFLGGTEAAAFGAAGCLIGGDGGRCAHSASPSATSSGSPAVSIIMWECKRHVWHWTTKPRSTPAVGMATSLATRHDAQLISTYAISGGAADGTVAGSAAAADMHHVQMTREAKR